jgi:hypothetical protein
VDWFCRTCPVQGSSPLTESEIICLRSKHLRPGRNGWDETGVLRYNGNFSGLRNLANFAKRTQVLMILRQARSKAAASCKDCYLELNSVKKRSNALGRKPSAWGAGLSTAGCLPRDGVGSLAGGSAGLMSGSLHPHTVGPLEGGSGGNHPQNATAMLSAGLMKVCTCFPLQLFSGKMWLELPRSPVGSVAR